MTHDLTLADATQPLTEDQLLAALLDITGDLDKAQVLHEALPVWMLKAKPEMLSVIEEGYRDSQRPRERTSRLLTQLKSLDTFCRERLKAFLADKPWITGFNEAKQVSPIDVMGDFAFVDDQFGRIIMQNFQSALRPGGSVKAAMDGAQKQLEALAKRV